jgi:hypothetical protein
MSRYKLRGSMHKQEAELQAISSTILQMFFHKFFHFLLPGPGKPFLPLFKTKITLLKTFFFQIIVLLKSIFLLWLHCDLIFSFRKSFPETLLCLVGTWRTCERYRIKLCQMSSMNSALSMVLIYGYTFKNVNLVGLFG